MDHGNPCADCVARRREELVPEIASIIARRGDAVCCYRTGGRVRRTVDTASGHKVGGDDGCCECRNQAREILGLIGEKLR